MRKVVESNYTQVPNAILDSLSEFSDSEVRLLMAMCRQTFGWQRGYSSLEMCIPFLAKAAGMSKRSVINASYSLEQKGFLIIKRSEGCPNTFSLVVLESDESFTKKAPEAVQNLHHPSANDALLPVQNLHQPNNIKENLKQIAGDGIEFDTFWKSYPRHANKSKAKAALQKALKKTSIETILKNLEIQKKTDQWTKDNGQFIPHPTSWLNGERWEDEVKLPMRTAAFENSCIAPPTPRRSNPASNGYDYENSCIAPPPGAFVSHKGGPL